ncbi:MAG: GlsB/YeaQ/YmgE family stress response membrane protein [Acidimicrobiia bacterium]|nr:GlsB/YeaQ/YmgE family stress response membrane protein [Acidimicrobiia bacterium]MDH5292721.1 GlsB/YeaQ/YmgE family stress response membrane protein [Acidimicrobiia bacterium]
MTGVLAAVVGGIIYGAIVGGLARLVIPGRQDMSLLVTIGCGLAGGALGGLIAEGLGAADTSGIDWLQGILSVSLAALAVSIYANYRTAQQAR